MARPFAGISDVAGVAFETASRAIPLPVSADDVERLLRSYVEERPEAAVLAICSRSSL